MICSVLIPSRGRINRLFAAIHTINESASSTDNFEILVRLDDDDESSLKFRPTLAQFKNVKVFTGDRHQGWASVESFYTELASHAAGTWCWFLLDDMVLGGRNWDLKLGRVPTKGFIVQPEISRLGGSTYPRWEGSNFPCVPTRCWENYGWNKIERPVDTGIDQLLRIKNGWRTHFLEGITAWHLEDEPDKLEQHRKL
jgi:hypothetical protein